MLSLPRNTAPASRSFVTTGASSVGTRSAYTALAAVVLMPGRVDVVLEPDRNAVQRPAVAAARELRLERARLGERLLGRDRDVGVHARIQALDALEIGARELDGRELARRDAPPRLRDRELRGVRGLRARGRPVASTAPAAAQHHLATRGGIDRHDSSAAGGSAESGLITPKCAGICT